MSVQFEHVQVVLKGVAPDEARLYQPMPDQIPYSQLWRTSESLNFILSM